MNRPPTTCEIGAVEHLTPNEAHLSRMRNNPSYRYCTGLKSHPYNRSLLSTTHHPPPTIQQPQIPIQSHLLTPPRLFSRPSALRNCASDIEFLHQTDSFLRFSLPRGWSCRLRKARKIPPKREKKPKPRRPRCSTFSTSLLHVPLTHRMHAGVLGGG